MTIAAGFVCDGGILLCSDTEIGNYASKNLARKIGYFGGPWGVVAGAVAGNFDYGIAAFQRMERAIKKLHREQDLPSIIEDSLSKSYAEKVFKHPKYDSGALDYTLIIALSEPGIKTEMYATNDANIRLVGTYRCEGIGRDVGDSVLKGLYRPDRLARDYIFPLASYMLDKVKNNVQACAGPSMFIFVSDDGAITELNAEDPRVQHLDNVREWFDRSASEFLLSHMCESDQEFLAQLKLLEEECLHVRKLWNTHPARQSGSPDHKSTKGDSSLPLPSPELPAGSDES